MKDRAIALYVCRADSAAESDEAASISRRLSLPVYSYPVSRGCSVADVVAYVERECSTRRHEPVAAVVVNAFIGVADADYPSGSRWPHGGADPTALLDINANQAAVPGCLPSVRLVWGLWARAGLGVPILIGTDGIGLRPPVRLALAEAIGDGLTCTLEDWKGRWRVVGSTTTWQATA